MSEFDLSQNPFLLSEEEQQEEEADISPLSGDARCGRGGRGRGARA